MQILTRTENLGLNDLERSRVRTGWVLSRCSRTSHYRGPPAIPHELGRKYQPLHGSLRSASSGGRHNACKLSAWLAWLAWPRSQAIAQLRSALSRVQKSPQVVGMSSSPTSPIEMQMCETSACDVLPCPIRRHRAPDNPRRLVPPGPHDFKGCLPPLPYTLLDSQRTVKTRSAKVGSPRPRRRLVKANPDTELETSRQNRAQGHS